MRGCGRAARPPGPRQRAGRLRVRTAARGRAQRGARVCRVAVGPRGRRGCADVRRHIRAEHDRAQGAVVRAGRSQATGRRGHVQLGRRVQARPRDPDAVYVPIELQRVR